MSGERPFDDGRWPDEEGFAECFVCGRKIDPLDKNRGTYTMNSQACEPLPAHLDPCLFGNDMMVVQVAFITAINQMTDVQAKRLRELARCATVAPEAH